MINLERELHNSYQLLPAVAEPQGSCEIELQVPLDFAYFKGHFPDFPVLPAVAIVDITHFFSRRYILKEESAVLNQIEHLKIKKPIRPGQKIRVMIKQTAARDFEAQWKSQDEVLALLFFSFQ